METEINAWAVELAEVVTPDEAELAPVMVQAYLKGGKDRQGLFHPTRGDIVGGFGAVELQAIFPWVLNAITLAAPLINLAITSGNAGKYLAIIKDLLELGDRFSRKKQVEALPDTPYLDLKKIIAVLPKELAKAKISDEQCELITFRVVKKLLEEPANSAKHVQQLAGVKK